MGALWQGAAGLWRGGAISASIVPDFAAANKAKASENAKEPRRF